MKLTITFLFLVFVFSQLNAQSSGIQFLEIGPTAAELSLSGAAVATPNGASSIYTNPSLLVLQDRPSLSFGYTNWILDTKNLFGGINLKSGNRAFAFSFYTSGISGFEQRNNPGESNGDFSIQYLSISGAYAINLKGINVGFSTQFLTEDIYPFRATGYAFNFGISTSLSNGGIRLGSSILNIGTMEKLDETATILPSTFNLGIAVDVLEFTHKKNPELPILFTLMGDFVQPIESISSNEEDFIPVKSYFNVGLELLVSQIVKINIGYRTQQNVRPMSYGIGFIAEKVSFDYAIIPFNTGFGTVHSIGLQYEL